MSNKNLTLGVGLATADGVPFDELRQRIALLRLRSFLDTSTAARRGAGLDPAGAVPDVTLKGTGRYTNAAGDTFTEPCLSLVWFGRGDDEWFIEAVRRGATKWCQLFEQEAFALTIGEATIHTISPRG
tara:strand:+ start:224 stop:607 length:384 start_codon:yes stop_codon:yes gene_type:complete